jgi:predicted GNAT family acetyltransferase
MNSIFVLQGYTFCIRKLQSRDLQHSYYDVMGLLSDIDRTMLRNSEILHQLVNEYVFFVVEDVHTHVIIGTGTVIIADSTNNVSQMGYIDNIMIRQDYQNIGLGEMMLQKLRYYCLHTEKCVRLFVNCETTM